VGFHGIEGSSSRYFQAIGTIGVNPDCYKGQEIVSSKPNSGDLEDSDQQTMLIIIIVCVVVVILISVAVIAFCIYKKNQLSKEQGGVEIVAHTKTRPSTPPVNKEKEPAAQNHTDEEDVGGAQGNVD